MIAFQSYYWTCAESFRLLQDVDAHLRFIDEQQNIDMSLVMGAPTARPNHTPDQMNMTNRPAMRLGRMRTLSTEMAAVGSMVSISRQTSLQSNGQAVRFSLHCEEASHEVPAFSA